MTDTAESVDWYDPASTTFGDRLTGAREAAGLEVEELAERLGVKSKTIRAWEADRTEPRANRVSMLAGLTNVSLVWLMTGVGDGPAVSPSMRDGDLLAEVERMRRDASQLTDRLRTLEGRLRARLDGEA
ncbi:helix-turn-helix domain-containing protein [Jannaschia sp. S6380]|uniref:helix-turn-helix domain-containing protein n=1 Tax=Jannaschia sp. S6380 TaxID=2926408 RepID=UPI001FF606E0|nr:helix-turn-helix transcriptional regulator [Jannaschia sp. S6380]MCK0167170.1 helix-turn-helix domain-containing protein [Jannaschia sp. S6380]